MISVIIPVYQAERFLEKAVRSAYAQDEVSEVILVEDGSTDKSLEVCNNLVRLLKPKVKLFQHKDGRNHGAGASRNLGISRAKCEFIAFLDADDFYLPGRFVNDIERFQKNSNIDGIYNALGTHVYDESEKGRVNSELTTVNYPIPPEKLFYELFPIGSSGYFSGDALTVRASIFDRVGLFDTTLELTQDTHMWIKMAAKATLVSGFIDRPVAIRGVHSENRVKNREKRLYYRPKLFLSLLKWGKQNNLSHSQLDKLYICFYNSYCKYQYYKNSNNDKYKVNDLYFFLSNAVIHPYLLIIKSYWLAFYKYLQGK